MSLSSLPNPLPQPTFNKVTIYTKHTPLTLCGFLIINYPQSNLSRIRIPNVHPIPISTHSIVLHLLTSVPSPTLWSPYRVSFLDPVLGSVSINHSNPKPLFGHLLRFFLTNCSTSLLVKLTPQCLWSPFLTKFFVSYKSHNLRRSLKFNLFLTLSKKSKPPFL